MTDRTRSYAWHDPEVLAAATQELGGLELLQRIASGELPQPGVGATVGFRLVEVEEGRAVFEGGWNNFMINPAGTLHGGWYGIILDSCMGCAVHSTLPQGTGYTTLEYKVNIHFFTNFPRTCSFTFTITFTLTAHEVFTSHCLLCVCECL